MSDPADDPRLVLLLDAAMGEPSDESALSAALRALGPSGPLELRALRDTAALATAALVSGRTPRGLEARLAAAGLAFCAEHAAPRHGAARATRNGTGSRWPAMLASAAAALLLAFAVNAWFARDAAAPELRAVLLASGDANVQWPLQRGPSRVAGQLRGDVVWSDRRQQGYLQLSGLDALPEGKQYQLWIVDAERTGAPVDGGLFDATAPEAVVPISPRLRIGRAAAFVLTVEDRGGVVVSAQEHVVALARS